MRKALSLLVILVFCYTAYSQGPGNDSLRNHFQRTYLQALKYNDFNVAINSMQNIIAETPAIQGMPLKDTLSMLYFATKAYYPALILAEEVNKANPSNINALARAGECYQNLGDSKKAVAAYETVSPILKNPYYYYQLAVCQYDLKRVAESEANIKRVMADTNSNHIAVNFTLQNGADQQVPASAAVLNLAAVMQMENKHFDQAKLLLQNALKLYPDFIGAQQNLQVVENNMKAVKQSGTKLPPKTKG